MSKTDSQQYVNWFRHSSPYINAYRGKTFVILLPGEALAHQDFANIAHDLTLLNSLGVRLVLVHGARPQIDAALNQAGLEGEVHNEVQTTLHNSLRVTDAASLDIIKGVVGKLRIELEGWFSMGLVNSPMHGAEINTVTGNYILAKPFGIHNGIDYAYTGEVRKVDHEAIQKHLEANSIVLISPLGYSPTGEVFNLTVDEVAATTAIALKADKLIIYSHKAGILDQAGEAINQLSADQAKTLIQERMSQAGHDEQLKNLQLSVLACMSGVSRSQVVSYQEDGALLIELFTRDGIGTLITQESYESIRPATIDDVGGILELIDPLEKAGMLVHRSRELLENEIEHFTVIEREGTIIACGALYPLENHCAEIACLVTHQDYQGGQRGQSMLEQLESSARKQGIDTLFVLTTKTPHWFLERDFKPSSVDALPEPKKQLYNYQRNSKVFMKSL